MTQTKDVPELRGETVLSLSSLILCRLRQDGVVSLGNKKALSDEN